MAKLIKIGQKLVGDDYPCFIIAEAGVNHNGSLKMAKQLVDAAVEAGADAVKFQTYITEDLILADIEKAAYQKVTTNANESQTKMLKRLEIDEAFHIELIKHCNQKKIMFLSTCYEEKSLALLLKLGIPVIKVASTDTTNLLFLEMIAKTGKPVILSTGMCDISEIQQAYLCLRENGCEHLALLKCTSNYPTDEREVNLKAMITLKEKFDAVVGFSDHTAGTGASPYAVSMGANIIEKHFTLDKNLDGPDHKASLSVDELVVLVKEIRKVELMLGSNTLMPTASEVNTKKALQKYLVSKVGIKKGEVITPDHITAKRTNGKGIAALDYFKVIGKTCKCEISINQPIESSFLAGYETSKRI